MAGPRTERVDDGGDVRPELRVRWRVIQGFRIDPAGGYQPGPMGLTSETAGIVKRPLPESSITAKDLATRVAGDPIETLPRLAMATRSFLLHPTLSPPPPAAPGSAARGTARPWP